MRQSNYYDPLHDKYLKRYFQKPAVRRNLQRTAHREALESVPSVWRESLKYLSLPESLGRFFPGCTQQVDCDCLCCASSRRRRVLMSAMTPLDYVLSVVPLCALSPARPKSALSGRYERHRETASASATPSVPRRPQSAPAVRRSRLYTATQSSAAMAKESVQRPSTPPRVRSPAHARRIHRVAHRQKSREPLRAVATHRPEASPSAELRGPPEPMRFLPVPPPRPQSMNGSASRHSSLPLSPSSPQVRYTGKQQRAACVIQSVIRGCLVRSSIRICRRSAIMIQRAFRRALRFRAFSVATWVMQRVGRGLIGRLCAAQFARKRRYRAALRTVTTAASAMKTGVQRGKRAQIASSERALMRSEPQEKSRSAVTTYGSLMLRNETAMRMSVATQFWIELEDIARGEILAMEELIFRTALGEELDAESDPEDSAAAADDLKEFVHAPWSPQHDCTDWPPQSKVLAGRDLSITSGELVPTSSSVMIATSLNRVRRSLSMNQEMGARQVSDVKTRSRALTVDQYSPSEARNSKLENLSRRLMWEQNLARNKIIQQADAELDNWLKQYPKTIGDSLSAAKKWSKAAQRWEHQLWLCCQSAENEAATLWLQERVEFNQIIAALSYSQSRSKFSDESNDNSNLESPGANNSNRGQVM